MFDVSNTTDFKLRPILQSLQSEMSVYPRATMNPICSLAINSLNAFILPHHYNVHIYFHIGIYCAY